MELSFAVISMRIESVQSLSYHILCWVDQLAAQNVTADECAVATLRILQQIEISWCHRHWRYNHRLQYSVLLYCSQQTYKQLISCHSSLTLASKWLVSIGLRLKKIFFPISSKNSIFCCCFVCMFLYVAFDKYTLKLFLIC